MRRCHFLSPSRSWWGHTLIDLTSSFNPSLGWKYEKRRVKIRKGVFVMPSWSRLCFPRCRWISPQAHIKGIQSNQLQHKLRANKFMMKPPVTLVAPMCRRSLNPAPWKDYVEPPRGVKSLKCSEKAAGHELVSLSPSVHLPALVSGGVSHLEALAVAAPRLPPQRCPTNWIHVCCYHASASAGHREGFAGLIRKKTLC